MSKSKSQAKNYKSYRLVLPMIIAITLLGLLGVLFLKQIALNADRERFSNAVTAKTIVTNALVNHLGSKALAATEQDECFQNGQGPYDNGDIWCQVATVITLTNNADFDSLGSLYIQQAKELGNKVHSDGTDTLSRYWYEAAGMNCSLSAIEENGKELGSATSDPFISGERPAVAIACADRAKAAYYPMAE